MISPTNIKPTQQQRIVLAIIATSATPKIAGGLLSKNLYTNTAAKILARMGLIIYDGVEAAFTNAGEQLASNENVLDVGGTATADAEALITKFNANSTDTNMAESLISQLIKL